MAMCTKRTKQSVTVPSSSSCSSLKGGGGGGINSKKIARDDDSIFNDDPFTMPLSLPQPLPTTSSSASVTGSASAPSSARVSPSLKPCSVKQSSTRQSASSSQLMDLASRSVNVGGGGSVILGGGGGGVNDSGNVNGNGSSSSSSAAAAASASASGRLVLRNLPTGKIHVTVGAAVEKIEVTERFNGFKGVPVGVDHMIRVEDSSGTLHPAFLFSLKENESKVMKWYREKLVEDFDENADALESQAGEGLLDDTLVPFPRGSVGAAAINTTSKQQQSPGLTATVNTRKIRNSRHASKELPLQPPTQDSQQNEKSGGYQSSVMKANSNVLKKPSKSQGVTLL